MHRLESKEKRAGRTRRKSWRVERITAVLGTAERDMKEMIDILKGREWRLVR